MALPPGLLRRRQGRDLAAEGGEAALDGESVTVFSIGGLRNRFRGNLDRAAQARPLQRTRQRAGVLGGMLGRLLLIFGPVLALPVIPALVYRELPAAGAFLLVGALTALAGWLLLRFCPLGHLGMREAVLLCTGTWLVCSVIAAIPVMMTAHLRFVDALFECTSGLTTTGLSILTSLETQTHALIFWRSESQLLGGLGILSFFLLVSFPGGAAHRFFHTEASKARVPRPAPSLRRTVMITWGIYGLLTFFNLLVLLILGGGGFASLNYAFTTVSTGGFSPHELGLGYYRSIGHPNAVPIEIATMIFMALGGLNFLLHYRALTGRVRTLFAGIEASRYWLLMAVGILLVLVESLMNPGVWSWLGSDTTTGQISNLTSLSALRLASFQVVSLTSSAGHLTLPLSHPFFGSAARQLFVFLIMVGGCVGSTAGGIKIMRAAMLGRSLLQEVRKLSHPEGSTLPVVVDGQVVEPAGLQPMAAMAFAWIAFGLLGGFLIALGTQQGPLECLTLSLAALSNTGPSLMPGGILPVLPVATKLLLIAWMIAGRLEILPVLALFNRQTWRH
jgi:trk system potassium uptake protein